VIWWRQSKTTGQTLHESLVGRQFGRANNRLLAGDDPVLDPSSTINAMEMKRKAEEKKFHQMARSTNFWRFGRVAKPYAIHRRNLGLKINRRLP
jgi:hypothetical protein